MDSYSYCLDEPAQDSSEDYPQPTIQTPDQTPVREHIPASIVVANLMAKLGQMLIRQLAPASYEPKITEEIDQGGQHWWKVYDPYTGRSHWLASEAEVMAWLDTYCSR
jgi:hypothetical protein